MAEIMIVFALPKWELEVILKLPLLDCNVSCLNCYRWGMGKIDPYQLFSSPWLKLPSCPLQFFSDLPLKLFFTSEAINRGVFPP